ncbi:Vacuolar membrane-associated protein iml1 [Lasiodiplodia theobromae]|uniref:Vacuolar membrane-associated protein iml1 n=1 Tax=Lasiodiplodia theobromae TaxID=45133 RepID=UPI0015C38119|nr:Vacuolar membrane-associated protein iml1 [Lasiodiplodia theobromae]KAF4546108.1 Vacuolar membrane-associated protein iml1 [Lasiodiplodia theobromae]
MPKSAASGAPKVQKVCTLWTHDDSLSREDVLFNIDRFSELAISPGSLVKIVALNQNTSVRDFQELARTPSQDGSRRIKLDTARRAPSTSGFSSRKPHSGSFTLTLDENGHRIQGGRDVDPAKTYVFQAKAMGPDLKTKYPNLQVSISDHIARNFGFRNRMQVMLSPAEHDLYSASHVEISFRDEYLSRADMWRFAIAELSGKTVYKGQKLLFMGTIKATVKNVFVDGQTTHSAYFSTMTKPVFRSESARYVLFLQMSKEMWNFDTEGSGEIMFNKVINGFLPDLFKRWQRLDAKHLVTIIMFTRMQYDRGFLPDGTQANGLPFDPDAAAGSATRDFYRVVVSEMASCDWINILYQLKKEFRKFLRDVSVMPFSPPKKQATGLQEAFEGEPEPEPESIIAGTPRTSDKGNLLEAINLAALQYSKDYIDRDLVRTGISVIVISPGSGIFEVDYNMLKLTTDILLGSGIGIDLVCLQPMPLHSVPLFKYRNPRLATETDHRLQKVVEADDVGSKFDFGVDDETPRQTFPNFGPLRQPKHRGSTSLAASPAKLGSYQSHPAIDPEPGDWSYAMPHWLDISYWSGSSDEIFGMEQVNKRGNPQARSQRKSKGFSLRCRMYELQMMGVMENEMSNISLPYLQENPLYPWSLLAPTEDGTHRRNREKDGFIISASSSPVETRSMHRSRTHGSDEQIAMHRGWMDTYDDHIFRTLSDRKETEEKARKDRQEKELEARHVLRSNRFRYPPNESLLSASFNSQAESVISSGRPPRSPSFLKGKEKAESSTDSFEKDLHSSRITVNKRVSVASRATQDLSTSPVGRDIRHPLLMDRANTAHRLPPRSVPAEMVPEDDDSPTKIDVDTRPPTPERGRGKEVADGGSNRSSNSSTNPRPSKWLSRHISFSAFGFGPSKAAPSTGVTASKVDAVGTLSKIVPSTSVAKKPSQLSVLSTALKGSDAHDPKRATEPIQIQSTSKKPSTSEASQSSLRVGSGTPKGRFEDKSLSTSHATADIKDPGSLFLLAGSKGLLEQVGPKLNLSSSGDRQEIPRTLSPTNFLAPWMVLVNPCNPRKNNLSLASQFRRWHHVFPRPLKATSIKWKSLCSPAAVPLTNDFFPNAEQLATEYNENPYRIIQNDEEELYATPKSRENLIRELIAFRLAHGFQIIIGPSVSEFTGKPEQDIADIFAKDYMLEAGSSIFMSLGSTIHQLVCVSTGEVEIKRFHRKPAAEILSADRAKPPFTYQPLIRTALDEKYELQEFPLKNPRDEYNWNFIDSYLAGYEQDFSDTLRFWRARFVLIPVEIPPNPRRHLSMLAEDSDEEIRLEGIRKLTQIWQKWRYVPPEERQYQAALRMSKDANPLAIEYQTRDPSAVVAAGPDGTILAEGTTDAFSTALFAGNEQYNRSNYDITKLAVDLQGEKGIPMTDRRWHFKLHLSCFLGFDLTTWLLQNFRDINTREQAVELGNEIMGKGLFHHVTRKHPFRDGNFFYQISTEYRAPRSETKSWLAGLSTRRSDKSSVPSTPSTEARPMSIASSSCSVPRSRPNTATSASESGDKTPTRMGSPRKQAVLSNVMRIDVDNRKRSYRPEVVNLHYDRLHNPDNCYHIRIEWMNATAKLIEDAINTWATSVEKYGLKLVELPIAEASQMGQSHPFRAPYMVRLACQPPTGGPQQQYFDSTSFGPQRYSDRFVYHKAILRKLNFVLDMESAASFPSDVDVTYSWGKPDYTFTQFIHKSGVLLAQITDDGDFLLLANRLCNNRGAFGIGLARDGKAASTADGAATATTTGADGQPQQQLLPQRREPTPIFALQNPTQNVRSPFASPLVRPVPDAAINAAITGQRIGVDKGFKTAEQIKDEMEALCLDERALRLFYAEFAMTEQQQLYTGGSDSRNSSIYHHKVRNNSGASPSPRISATAAAALAMSSPRMTPVVLDANIPSLGLPPGVTATAAAAAGAASSSSAATGASANRDVSPAPPPSLGSSTSISPAPRPLDGSATASWRSRRSRCRWRITKTRGYWTDSLAFSDAHTIVGK